VKADTGKKTAKKDGDIFEAKKEEYKPSEERKADQVPILQNAIFLILLIFVRFSHKYACVFFNCEKLILLNLYKYFYVTIGLFY
jgi:hypothetical protein